MAAYRTAARLFPGLHLPLLGMGMEYQRMSNLALAEQLFRQGHATCPADPLLCNELGVVAFRNHHYQEAEQWLNKALDRLPDHIKPGTISSLSSWLCCISHWPMQIGLRKNASHTNTSEQEGLTPWRQGHWRELQRTGCA